MGINVGIFRRDDARKTDALLEQGQALAKSARLGAPFMFIRGGCSHKRG